jgi:CRISPR-associated exonuclease Cas4
MIQTSDAAARVRALTELDATLLVEAAAGTGKTALIAGRAAMSLLSGIQPRELAAITFTQAAADELQLRINQYVRDLLDGDIPDCLSPVLRSGLSAEQQATLGASAKNLDELTVTTIHGFCQKIIVSYAVEADIDPGARMMDGPQADSEFNAVFHRWVRRRLIQTRGPDDPIEALSKKDPRSVIRTLKSLALFRRRHRTARAVPADLSTRLDLAFIDEVARFKEWMSQAPAEPATLRLLTDLEQLAHFYADCLAAVPAFPHLWALAHPPTIQSMRRNSADLKSVKAKGSWQRLAGKEKGAALNDQSEEIFRRVDGAYRALHGRIATALCDVLSRELDEVLEDYHRFKRMAAVLDFDDLLHNARNLVRGHDEVRRALGERFKVIFVDEFQDTDPLQAEILFRIAATEAPARWEESTLRPGALFMVGDPKQAIYRFRGADIDSYARARNALSQRWPDNILQITANFRSVPGILTYINRRFDKVLSEAGQPGYVPLSEVRPSAAHGLPCVAKQSIPVVPGCTADQFRDAEAEEVAQLCARLVGNLKVPDLKGQLVPLTPGGIALLTPTQWGLWRYERALEVQGLPFASRAAKSLLRRQEVQDILALARALADSQDTLAFGAFLRGPLVGLTDEELLDITAALPTSMDSADRIARFSILTDPASVMNDRAREVLIVLQDLRRLSHSMTPAQLLAKAVENFCLRPLLAARDGNRRSRAAANVERFLEISRTYDIAGLKRFAQDMTKEWASGQDERVEGRVDAEGAIELVTMHSAKGLEWPVVILINTVGQVVSRNEFVHRVADDTIHWLLRDVAPPELAVALAEDARLSDSERQRVWYVACSRARELLIIPQVPPRNYDAWSGVIADVYEGLSELPTAGWNTARTRRSAELENNQTRDVFGRERKTIQRVTREITWFTPSEHDPDRMPAEVSPVIDQADDVAELPLPVGAGLVRGLVLHKLIEEVLTGELSPEETVLAARAQLLVGQLYSEKSIGLDAPQPHELARTVLRTLTLPEIAAMTLHPEVTVYGMKALEPEAVGLAGRADAMEIGPDGPSTVVDWKSDVAPTDEDIQAHAGQLMSYMTVSGASRGALVYMTSGTIRWVERS